MTARQGRCVSAQSHESFRGDPEVALSWTSQLNHWHSPSRLKSFKVFPSPLEGFSGCPGSIACNDFTEAQYYWYSLDFSLWGFQNYSFQRQYTLNFHFLVWLHKHTYTQQRDHLSGRRLHLVCKQTSWQSSLHPLHNPLSAGVFNNPIALHILYCGLCSICLLL